MHHGKKKLYGVATVGTKGQVVIPADARDELGIKTGDKLYVANAGKGGVVFLKEDMLESLIAKMTDQIEDFREFKKTTKDN
jgi:AbrB family looped-hinge helix DNA binding protein